MDPNLKTLSLAAWMSLPNFDFATWESLNKDESLDENHPAGLIHQASSINSSKKSKKSCTKCQNVREKNSGRFTLSDRSSTDLPRNIIYNNEVSPSVCNCTNVSLKFNLTDGKRLTVNEIKSSKGTNRNSVAQSRSKQKESQSRALVSKVAKYYENYVTRMNLQKYFVNDVIVTSIVPVHWKDPKCKGARWIVIGYVQLHSQFC